MNVVGGRSAHVAGLAAAARAAGRVPRTVSGGWSRRGTLRAFGRDLGFPDYYGVNLDALVDCLRDLDSPDGRPFEVIWNSKGLRRRDPGAYADIVGALAEVDAERPDMTVTVLAR